MTHGGALLIHSSRDKNTGDEKLTKSFTESDMVDIRAVYLDYLILYILYILLISNQTETFKPKLIWVNH